jgi:hypothetical protein
MKDRRRTILLLFTAGVLFGLLFGCDREEGARSYSPRDSVNRLITRDGLKAMTIALELYKQEFGAYPDTLEEILRNKDIDDESVIHDAWGREYHYVKLGGEYSLFSPGKDGKPFTDDDIYPEDQDSLTP